MNDIRGVCECAYANFAVVGYGADGGKGILNWFGDEISSHKFKKDTNKNGGDLNTFLKNGQENVLSMIFNG